MKDFTKKRIKIEFQVDGETFEATPAIPADLLTDFVVRFSGVENIPNDKRIEAFREVLSMVLKPESFERFRVRLRDLDNPIDINQLKDIIVWLMGEYGERPTQSPSESSDGARNPESGMNSMDNSFSVVSTFNPSPLPAS